MIDIHNPAHVEALRWACETKTKLERVSIMAFAGGSRAGKTLKHEALEALESPAESADIIRQLVERAGLVAHKDDPGDSITYPCACVSGRDGDGDVLIEYWIAYTEEPEDWAMVVMGDIPGLIIRLLALAPNAGAEAVLRALRGET